MKIEPKKKSKSDYIFYGIGLLLVLYMSCQVANIYDEYGFKDFIVFGEYLFERLNTQPSIYVSASTIKFCIVSGLFSLLVIEYMITSKKNYIDGKEYGTAVWGKSKELDHLVNKDNTMNQLLTQTEKLDINNYEVNAHTLICGGSGSGKTRAYVMPNLLNANGKISYVITDPKGEILRKSGKYLKKQGYHISVLNLDDMSKSAYYNPFHYINPEKEEDVMMLIKAIMENTDDPDKKGGDGFWDKAELLYLQSIFYYILYELPKEEQHIPMVLELMRMSEIKEDDEDYKSDFDILMDILEREKGSDHIAVVQYKHFKVSAGKTAKSIIITASARLSPYNIKALKNLSLTDDMKLDEVGKKPTAVFVIMPPSNKTYSFVSGMLFTQLFQVLNYQANNEFGGVLPMHVRCVLDEFANTCKIPNFVEFLAYARSLNIGIVPILQSLEQLKKMYKDDWQVILDNCSSFLFLGSIKNMDTLKYVSELIGKGTYDKRNMSRTKGRQSSTSRNEDRLGRSLLEPNEIQKMKKKKCILFVSGYSPFFSDKINYKQVPNYKYTADYNKKNAYEYEPYRLDSELENSHGEESVEDTIRKKINKVNIDIVESEEVLEYLKENISTMDFVADEILSNGEEDGWENKIIEETINIQVAEQREVIDSIFNEIAMHELTEEEVQEQIKQVENMEIIEDEYFSVEHHELEQVYTDVGEYIEEFSDEDLEQSLEFADSLEELSYISSMKNTDVMIEES